MMTLYRIQTLLAATLLVTPLAVAQHQNDFDTPGSSCPLHEVSATKTYQTGHTGMWRGLRDTFGHEWQRLRSGYDYQAPLDSIVEDRFRAPLSYRSSDPRSPYSNYGAQTRRNSFRLPSYGSRGSDRYSPGMPWRDRGDYQTRYRLPLREIDDSSEFGRSPIRHDSGFGQDPGFEGGFESPVTDLQPPHPGMPARQIDPFTPALPRRDAGNEIEAIRKAITARYSDPVTVRTVHAMSPGQALTLYREVSRQTDQRHLEPSSYDLRIRRGLRNLALAVENQAFTSAMRIQSDSFRLDGFRSTLTRIADGMQVTSQADADRIVQTVMQQAGNVPGLSASAVAFEFAGATIDTLDKFSALEPSEPGRGAALPVDEQSVNVKSAGLESEIVGIGVEIKAHDDGLVILKTLRGGPAREAGLKAGDVITAIDGNQIGGVPMANSVDMMKGTSGSRMQLSIVRNSSSHNLTLTRRRVRLYTVNDARILSGSEKVAYINLSQFGQRSLEEMDQALMQLHRSGMESLIVDLRGNPGGLLNVCVDITNRFLPCGTIVSTRGRLSSDNMRENATFNRTWSTPLVVLIDGDSASASEIFAAAVQDNKRGIVVGERSYGKGTVQTHFPLTSISGNLRLTTARFYSPSGRAMSGSGVTPDVPVTDEDGVANGDRVLREAVQIAQSQRLRDIAQAARSCRPRQQQYQQNTFRKDHFDTVGGRVVL